MSTSSVKRILIAGGTGGIGLSLRNRFSKIGPEKAYSFIDFTILTRSKKNTLATNGLNFMTWDELKSNGLPDVDSVINLCGANILESSWKKDGKVYSSRIDTTRTLVKEMEKNPPKSYVQASAVGIYPSNTDQVFDEHSTLPDYNKMNFPQQLCYDWEQEALKAKDIKDLKTTIFRIPFVLGRHQHGTKSLMLPLNIIGIGKIGSGQQAFPWIHEHDLTEMMFHASLNPNVKGGTINAVTDQIITQEQFSTVFNRKLGTLFNMPLPEVALKLIGQKSVLLLEGPKVKTVELANSIPDFQYQYPTIHKAIDKL